MKPKLNHLQAYLAQEFVDDYHNGYLTRRQLLTRILWIAGGVASGATVLLSMGCEPSSARTPTPAPALSPSPAPAPSPAAGGSPSRLSVAPDDPAITVSDVTFPGDGATLMGYLVQPGTGGPFPAVIVCHENRGLNDHIRDVTRRLGKAGYAALALDLLSRDGGTQDVNPDQVPAKLTADPARNVSDFQATFRYLQTLSSVQRSNIGMIGFCFGGGMTWLVATAIPELKAAVPYYGPNPPLTDVPKIRAAVLAIYGETDQRINAGIPAIEQAMQQNGKTFEKIIYPGAGHAFNNDTGPNWREEASYDAWDRALAWFKKYLV